MKSLFSFSGFFVLLLLLASAPLYSQARLVEKVTRKKGTLTIPYEKYVLPNGLTVIIHEDHSDPLVHVDVTYHVGSAREEIGKSGFAHFFEHMMFQGSDHVADEEHFKIVTESGGTLNGSTNRDRTNYYQTLPSNMLEVALWLESDRMGFLLDAVTQQKFEIQRSTVKNERGQNYDNRPYGLSREVMAKNLYPYGHPYSWLTIGYVEDLNRVDVDDLKRFFLRWYGPNNATLTVGGDVDPKDVLRLAEKYFGSIPKGPEVKKMPSMAPIIDSDRYVSYVDNYIRFPMLMFVLPTSPTYHPDEAALDCLADLLGGGKNSPLYQNFVKSRKALQASVFNSTSELSGEFTFSIVPTPGQNLADMEALIRQTLSEFAAKGISQEDVDRFKNKYEAQRVNGLQSVSGKVSQLAAYQTYTGNPNLLPRELEEIRALKVADVQRVLNQYILNKKGVIVSVLPKTGDVAPAAPDNFKIDSTQYQAPADQYAGLAYNKPKDSFERSQRPQPGKSPLVEVPPLWTSKLKNGIDLIGTRNEEVPTVTIQMVIRGGQRMDPLDKIGLANLTAQMMREGTQNYSAEAFEEALQNLGASISVNASEQDMTITLNTLVRNLDKSLALLEERLFRSKMEAADFERIQQNAIKGLANRSTQAQAVANDVFNYLLYGPKDVRGYPSVGTEITLNKITLSDVQNFYRENFSAGLTRVVIVGDVEQKDILPRLGFLEQMTTTKAQIPNLPEKPKTDKTRIYLVDQPKAAQSEIRIGYMALPYDGTGEFFRATMMNYILGGAFNSRINLNLREDKGYTYGARSTFVGSDLPGPFVASAGVKAEASDSSVIEFMREITRFRDEGITDAELEFLKSSIGQSEARLFETGFQKAAFLNRLLTYGLEKDYVKKQKEILEKMTRQDILGLAKKHLHPERAFIVVVGDKASIQPGLEKLGYEVVELQKNGQPVPVTPRP